MSIAKQNLNRTESSLRWLRYSMLLVLVTYLCACGSGNTKKTLEDKGPTLAPTLAFIPVVKFDKEGKAIPYEAKANPYLKQRGRLKKTSVAKYIEARRAYKRKRYSSARAILEGLVKEDPGISGPFVMLGDIAVINGQKEKAVMHFEQALKINASNINAYLRLAKVQRELGRFIEAQNTYATALKLWPDFPEAHLNLAILYDLYFNHALNAQKHMEAYQFLTDGKNKQVAKWLAELRQRTGVARTLKTTQNVPKKPVS